MSLSRTFFNEFRPFFRLFDDAARSTRSPYSFPTMYRHFALFDDFVQSRHPTLDFSERDNDYIVEAEVPGVKKEDLEVMVGDNGRSLTIEGKVLARAYKNDGNGAAATATEGKTAASANGNEDASTSNEVTKPDSSTPTVITSERDSISSSHFTRSLVSSCRRYLQDQRNAAGRHSNFAHPQDYWGSRVRQGADSVDR